MAARSHPESTSAAPLPARAEPEGETEIGIYIHWPFCLSRCPYCDFNAHVRDRIDQRRWRAALLAELDHYADETPGRTVTSIYFGGGTPSLMDPEVVAALVEHSARRWPTAADVEVTLEANPTPAESRRFAGFRDAGVNRVSLGAQAFDDEALAFLGRGHSRAQAVAALAAAQRHFPNVSFDLIYARPGQSVAAWRAELREALAYAAGHLSAYQLTIEPGTPFHAAFVPGALAVPDEDLAAALYETTQDVLAAAGLPAYEISHHARPGAECRHNLTYWRCGEYIGIGPGAHGRLRLGGRRVATEQRRAPESWLGAVEAKGHATRARAALGPDECRDEILMMGLRLTEGVSRARFRRAIGKDFEAALEVDRLTRLSQGGFLALDPEGLRATPAGRQRLNAVLAALLG